MQTPTATPRVPRLAIDGRTPTFKHQPPLPPPRFTGTLQGFYTGIAIALPSGIGVGLSLLGDNQASLVGVAISASLLPPAVNAGMLWALACLPVRPYNDATRQPIRSLYNRCRLLVRPTLPHSDNHETLT